MTDAELDDAICRTEAAAWERGEWEDDALLALVAERHKRYQSGVWTGQTAGAQA